MDAETTWWEIESALLEPGFPEQALRRALERWDEVGGHVVSVIDRCASDPLAVADEQDLVLCALVLCGERRERSAFGPIMRLLEIDIELLDAALGDGVGEILIGAICKTFDGRSEILESLASDMSRDEILRGTGLEAMAILAANGALPRERLDHVIDVIGARIDDEDDWVVDTWQTVVAGLAIERWVDVARKLLIEPNDRPCFQDLADFDADLAAARAGEGLPDYIRLQADIDLIGALSRLPWPGRDDADESDADDDDPSLDLAMPAVNPFRDVGRNDPCPCGSGLKFKRCCMQA